MRPSAVTKPTRRVDGAGSRGVGLTPSNDAIASLLDLVALRHAAGCVTAPTARARGAVRYETGERPGWLVVDARPGMQSGTRCAFKSVVAARAAALLAWSAYAAGERVGGLVVSPQRVRVFEPRAREQHVLAFLAALSRATIVQGREAAAPLASCLDRVRERAGVGSRIFVISDFDGLGADGERRLAALAQRSDVTCIAVHDVLAERREVLRSICDRHGIDLVAVRTDDDLVARLGGAVRRRRGARVRGEA